MMSDDLDQLLQRAGRPMPVPDALMARILADAARVQPRPARAPWAGFWDVFDMVGALFGGRGAVAGLASVACAGLYLGAAQPSALVDFALALGGAGVVDQLDFMPSIDMLMAEE
jgi:hypothetical protein